MPNDVRGLLINLASSALTGLAVWLAQRWLARRRLQRMRAFFGLAPGVNCLLVVPRHAPSASGNSVHRTDVAALLELSGLIRAGGAPAEVAFHDQPGAGFGTRTEFCIGGPEANTRAAAHLRRGLPGVTVARHDDDPALTIRIGTKRYPREPDMMEHVVVAKIVKPDARPVFLICGQVAVANQAAVGYLASRYRDLLRTHGAGGQFCLLLRVIEPAVYGPGMVEFVADVTADAFSGPRAVTAEPSRG